MSWMNETETLSLFVIFFPSESSILSKPTSLIYYLETKSDILFVAENRCEVREKEIEIKEMKEQMTEMKEQMTELVGILRHSESRRKEVEKQSKQKEQTAPMATTPPVRFLTACNHMNPSNHTFDL